MYNLSDNEIDYILEDIQKHGVTAEDLQQDLLDHMCCLLEEEMYEGADFFEFYLNIRARFYTHSLKEIQEERDKLFIFKEYYAMKNTLKYTGLLSAFLTITGALLKIFHLPGAGITIVLGGFLFTLIFLPLMIALKFRDEEKTVDKWVFSIGFLLAMSITTGMIFKMMHWPFANKLTLIGLVGFIFIYIPLYYITRIRRPELRFNTIINSVLMMACGGLLFAMYNLGYSKKVEEANAELFVQMEQNSKHLGEKVMQYEFEPQLVDSTLRIEGQELLSAIASFQAKLIAHIEEISIEEASKRSISSIENKQDLELIKHFITSEKGKINMLELKKSIDNYNLSLTSLKKDTLVFKSENFESSSYGSVLIQLLELKQAVYISLLP